MRFAFSVALCATLLGCSSARVDTMKSARVASDYAADIITIASKSVENSATADAQAKWASCTQELWADRYVCKKSAIDAAILAARPAEARVRAVVEIQHALADALTAAGACETSDKARSCRDARSRDVALAAAKLSMAVKSLAEASK